MSFAGPTFVLAIIAMAMAAWVLTTWIRARHGYPIEDQFGGTTHKGDAPPARRQLELLAIENEALKAQLARQEERLAVLERIVTDPARRVASDIDALR
jgi:hypothetical protein